MWTLDPIDGTEGFIRDGQFAVTLALIVGGRPEIGILGCPRLSLSADTGAQACDSGSIVRTFDEVIAALHVTLAPTLMDSQVKHAVLAAGRADLMLRLPAQRDFRDKIWDQAAGTVILEEAGGRATDVLGAELDFSAGRVLMRNEGVVASNGKVHAAALEAIRHVMLRT